MKAIITTVVITIGTIFTTQGQERLQEADYNIESYDVGTYEWYHFDEDPDLYIMEGSKPQMEAEAKKQLGKYQFDRHKESGFITDGIHYKLWTHVTVDGRDAMVMLIDEDFGSKINIGFYNGGGAPPKL